MTDPRSLPPRIIEMPYLAGGHDLAHVLVDALGEFAGEWVICDWRLCRETTPGFLAVLERRLYDGGARVTHAHLPESARVKKEPGPAVAISKTVAKSTCRDCGKAIRLIDNGWLHVYIA